MALKLIADYVSDSDTDEATDRESSGLPIKAIVLKNNIINACMHGPKPSNTGKPAGGETLRQLLMNNVPNAGTGHGQQSGPAPTIEQPVVLVPSGTLSTLLGGPSGAAPSPGLAVAPQMVLPVQTPIIQAIPPRGLSALLGFGSPPARPQVPEAASNAGHVQAPGPMMAPQCGLSALLGFGGPPVQAAGPAMALPVMNQELVGIRSPMPGQQFDPLQERLGMPQLLGSGAEYILRPEQAEQECDPRYGFPARVEKRAMDAGVASRYIQEGGEHSNSAQEVGQEQAALVHPNAQGYGQVAASDLATAAAASPASAQQEKRQFAYNREPREIRLSSSSDSSDFEIESVKDAQSVGGDDDEEVGPRRAAPRVPGELDLADLPPIEDLQISVPPSQVVLMGKVVSVIEQVVIVESLPENPAIDLDSVLFLDKGARTLGSVHDVFGNVSSPYYVVRFNSPQHIVERDVRVNMEVYYAPQTQFSKYVFYSELMKYKGTDASWLGDVEPPQGVEVDFSDDEAERQFMKRKRNLVRANRRSGQHSDKSNAVGHNSERNATEKPPEGPPRLDRVLNPIEPARFQPPNLAPGPVSHWQMARPRFEEPPHPFTPHVVFGPPMYHPFRHSGPVQYTRPNLYPSRYINNNNNDCLNYYRPGRGNI